MDELFLKYQETGEENYIRQLVIELNPKLFKLIYKITGDRQVSKDILQNTWLAVIDHRNSFNPRKGCFANYIFHIAKHEAFCYIRKSNRFSEVVRVEYIEIPAQEIETQDLRTIIMDSIGKLKKKHLQDVILLHYFSGMKMKEIAETLNTNEQNIKNWLLSGKKELRTIIAEHPDYEEIFDGKKFN